jgi:predicted transposase/invertase (TIGR01784 family)
MEEEEHDRLTDATEIIFYEMPKLEQKVQNMLAGKADMQTLSAEEKWCMFLKYRHEVRAEKLIEELSRKEEGIMRAERAAAKMDRDYEKFARKMAEMKNSLDIALTREAIRRKGLEDGHTEKALEIAKKMKNAGRPLSEIEEFTGLQTETINKM